MTDHRFELIERLGSGGMATVWRARDTRLHREIALKRPLPHLVTDPEMVARFEREARAAAALNHPNVVTVYDAGEDDEGPWLSMELVHGISLRRVLDRRGLLPVDQVVDYIGQAAAGLDAAHERGLIHRDIKPENLLLGDDGRIRVSDFGLARPVSQDTPITQEGAVVGSARYLAPEALAGDRGTSGDIYSLAAVAYEMLTGRPPLDAPTLAALLERIRTESPPPPSQLRPLTSGYDALFASALSKSPSGRPQTAGAFGTGLATAGGATLPLFPPPAPSPAAVPRLAPQPADTTVVVGASPDDSSRRLPVALRATLAAAGAAIAVVIAIVIAANAGSEPGAAAADTNLAVATSTTSTTVAPTTTAAATTTTTTVTTTTTLPLEAVIMTLVVEMSDSLDAATPGELKPKEARSVDDDVHDAATAFFNGDGDRALEKLEDAAKTIDDKVDSPLVRSGLLDLLRAVAASMGIELRT